VRVFHTLFGSSHIAATLVPSSGGISEGVVYVTTNDLTLMFPETVKLANKVVEIFQLTGLRVVNKRNCVTLKDGK
jgi:hypothetical protein